MLAIKRLGRSGIAGGVLSLAFIAAGMTTMASRGVRANAEPAADGVLRSAQSGAWSAPATWEGGKVPGAAERVLIREGHRVVYDVQSDEVLRGVNVAGTLSFAPDKSTRLNVGLIKIQTGDEYSEVGFDCTAHVTMPEAHKPRPALEVGTPDRPIDSQHTALIRLSYIEGMDKKSCPAIVCCGGRMDFHGTPLSHTWVKLGGNVTKGDVTVSLAEAVTGWRVGDRIIVTATHRIGYGRRGTLTEERTIRAIDGVKLTLDQPLEQDHLGSGEYRGEVANLSRNVTVESANPEGERGHTMYHRHSAGSIGYAEFRHLGKEGVLGRYSLHFHLVGDSMRGSSVVGASIWDSGNRWLTIHGTNYLVVRDCVGYNSIGHGFFLEDGTEVFNVLDHNLAVGAKRGKRLPQQVLPFDQNEGAGFWWANSLNTFTRNVAVENGEYGFRYEATASRSLPLVFAIQQPDGSQRDVDIRTLPFVRCEDNEIHSGIGLYGFNLGEGVNRVGPDTRHPFVIRNLKIWDQHYAFRPQAPSLLVENLHIHRAAYGVYHPNYDNHVYRTVSISEIGAEPFNRGHDDLSIQYGVLTVDGLTFEHVRSGRRIPLIQISDQNPTGNARSHFRNVQTTDWTGVANRALVNRGGDGPRPEPQFDKGVPVFLHDWFGSGKHALVASTAAPEYKRDDARYREVALLTGDESRVTEVENVSFPELLNPVDDLPPTTVITHVAKRPDGKITISGTTADNGIVTKVLVNGSPAQPLAANFAEWKITLQSPVDAKLSAHSEDAAGNVEPRPHVVVW